MRLWGITDIGMVRRENQDAYAIQEDTPSGHAVCVVCDGMGGPAGGRMASAIAVETYLAELVPLLREDMDPRALSLASAQAVSRANAAIREAAAKTPDYQNMGTTLVSAIACAEGAVVSNVGDSRAYCLSGDRCVRITRDHSLVQNMVERGDITAEEARHHPKRNLITRALGPDENVECDGFLCRMSSDSLLLLCTDGLTNMLDDEELRQILSQGPEGCLERLVGLAKDRGAPDNVTAVLMQWP